MYRGLPFYLPYRVPTICLPCAYHAPTMCLPCAYHAPTMRPLCVHLLCQSRFPNYLVSTAESTTKVSIHEKNKLDENLLATAREINSTNISHIDFTK